MPSLNFNQRFHFYSLSIHFHNLNYNKNKSDFRYQFNFMQHSAADFSALYNIKSRRKIERKNKKKLKATCRLAYAQHKKVYILI